MEAHKPEYEQHVLFVDLEELSDIELLEIVDELQCESFSENSIARQLAKQYFGGDSLVQIISVSLKVLPVIAKRMKYYSPHIY